MCIYRNLVTAGYTQPFERMEHASMELPTVSRFASDLAALTFDSHQRIDSFTRVGVKRFNSQLSIYNAPRSVQKAQAGRYSAYSCP